MYLGVLEKPHHKAECQCTECFEWMSQEITRLRCKCEDMGLVLKGGVYVTQTTNRTWPSDTYELLGPEQTEKVLTEIEEKL